MVAHEPRMPASIGYRYTYQGIETDQETGWNFFALRTGACPEPAEGTRG